MDLKTNIHEATSRAAMVHLDKAWVEAYRSGTFQEALYELSLRARLAVQAHQSAISYVPDGDFQKAIHTHSFSEKFQKYNSYDVMPTGEGIWGVVVKSRRAVRMTDAELQSHPQWRHFSSLRDSRGLEHPEMRGWLAVPILRRDGGFLGVLQASDKFAGEFTEADLDEFTHVAKMIAPTFELQFVNQSLQRRAEELEVRTGQLECTNEALKQAENELRRAHDELELRVQKRTSELAAANQALEQSNIELQQFAYIASHDLQAPLRGIAGFAQFLQQDYQGKLDGFADEYIGQIVEGAQRMQRLISDLLAYSRVESRARAFTPTDLATVFDDAVTLLRAEIEYDGGEVTRDELPTVVGDPAQLSQLLQNLLGNAVKYHGIGSPRVHVSAARNGSAWTIAVRDNGIGMEAKHFERIFEIFRRLHTQEQYPGTGIGLAVCRRIVLRHGGRIWVESQVGKGSTFFFTVPDRAT